MTDVAFHTDDGEPVAIADDRELERDGCVSGAARMLERVCTVRRLRRRVYNKVMKLENGQYRSATIRRVLRDVSNVCVGMYSYGPCMMPGAWPAGVTIGRYASVAEGVRIFRRNHPLEHLSLHPYFYNPALGVVPTDTIESAPLWIGHDAWIGAGSTITPGCCSIGIGAVVGAGAVVTKDVPDFAVVAGNPAKHLKYRFEPELCASILESRWWEQPIEQLKEALPELTRELRADDAAHPVFRARRSA